MPALAKTEIIARAKKVPVTAYYGINESPCHSRGVSYLERHYLDARYIIHFLHDGPCGQVVFRNETHGSGAVGSYVFITRQHEAGADNAQWQAILES